MKMVKSDNFGGVQCDIYNIGSEYYMTREQIGRALEYSEPGNAIEVIHRRKKERLDMFSTTVKLTGVDGKLRNYVVYSRKGVMEICRHSGQPKADAFMDWVWDTMDGLIAGRTQGNPKQYSFSNINSMARILLPVLKDADMDSPFLAEMLKRFYAYAGIEIPLHGIIAIPVVQLFDSGAIAKRLGIYSSVGNPHSQAVSAIIDQLDIADGEREAVPFQCPVSGHSSTNYQYTESVSDKVANLLAEHNYPKTIHKNRRNYTIIYKADNGF